MSQAETTHRTRSTANTTGKDTRATEATKATTETSRGLQTINKRTGNQRPASWGNSEIPSPGMASNHGQFMGFTMYTGVPFGVWGCPTTEQLAPPSTYSLLGTMADPGSRDPKPPPKRRCRKRSQHKGLLQPMFTVPKKDGGWRPIINLKHLNTFLEVPYFKMEGISSLKDILQRSNFMEKSI